MMPVDKVPGLASDSNLNRSSLECKGKSKKREILYPSDLRGKLR